MGVLQQQLKELLRKEGAVFVDSVPFPKTDDLLGSPLVSEMEHVYRALGGVLPSLPIPKLRRWDMEFEQIAVELDEELHFNGYREITLQSPCYKELCSFPLALYRRYCAEHAAECRSAGGFGGKWSNNSCVSQFG